MPISSTSAAASWPYYFAAWAPERTLCALSVSGQWPYYRHKDWAPDIWGDRNIDFVPSLETMGEYESAATWSREGLKERQDHPRMPLSMLACPGEGHFASSDTKAEFLAFYLRKAVQYRVPRDWKADAPPFWRSRRVRYVIAPSIASAANAMKPKKSNSATSTAAWPDSDWVVDREDDCVFIIGSPSSLYVS